MRYETGLSNRLGNRANNQDRCACLEHYGNVLLLLADGLGGHKGGELAAQQFIDSMTLSFQRQQRPVPEPGDFLQDAITKAHHDISRLGVHYNPPFYPRTTCIACLVQDGTAYWAHVGDSRLYLIRNADITIRTRDHTYIEELVRNEVISEEDMSAHPMRNYVSHCLGGPNHAPPITHSEPTELVVDDIVLLCSDGLWNAVKMKKLIKFFNNKRLEAALDAMTNKAERATYPHSDNISAIAMRFINKLDSAHTNNADATSVGADTVVSAKGDSLSVAIDDIQGAIEEYKQELDKD